MKVDEYTGTRSALALHSARMTHGVHYANFHILCANTFKRSPTVPRVGVPNLCVLYSNNKSSQHHQAHA